MSTRFILRAFRLTFLILWAASCSMVYAAVTFAAAGAPIVLDPTITALSAFLSTLSGGTALFIRIDKQLRQQEADARQVLEGAEPPGPVKFERPYLFATAHMGGSWLAGAVGFLAGHAYEWNVWYGLIGVVLASFAGSTFLEKAAEKWLNTVPLTPPGAKKT